MPIKDPARRAEKQRQYRLRDRLRDSAVLMGIEEIPLAFFGIDKHGHHVAIGIDNKRIDLSIEGATPVESKATPHDRPKVYAPKTIPAKQYAGWKAAIVERQSPRQAVIDSLTAQHDKLTAADDATAAKQFAQLRKMVEAIPDTPDWITHIPEPEEALS